MTIKKFAPGQKKWRIYLIIDGRTDEVYMGKKEEVMKRFEAYRACLIRGAALEEVDGDGEIIRRIKR